LPKKSDQGRFGFEERAKKIKIDSEACQRENEGIEIRWIFEGSGTWNGARKEGEKK
jgi:hypothetical protein